MQKFENLAIRDLFWKLVIAYLDNYKKNYNIFEEKIGKGFLQDLKKIKSISKYQWKALSREKYSLLELYCRNFLQHMKVFQNKNKIINPELDDSFRLHFESQIYELESRVLLCDYFEYKILIPAFRITFPENQNEVILDGDHIIKNIYNESNPYGIPKFKRPPRYWDPFEKREGVFRDANACFEIIFRKRKKLSTDPPYDENFTPYYPIDHMNEYSVIFDKVLSIYDFFFCYMPHRDFPPFTFGYQYFVLVPPFSQPPYPPPLNIPRGFIGYRFHYPKGFLDLRDSHIYDFWINHWKKHYTNFYYNYYRIRTNPEPKRLFRYTIDVLRTEFNIPYVDMKIFYLISTFEGFLHHSRVKKEIIKNLNKGQKVLNRNTIRQSNKSIAIAKIFAKICEDQGVSWNGLLRKIYSNRLKYLIDLERFIISAYQHRNNIAHPEKQKPINFRPKYLYQHYQPSEYVNHLANLILEYFRRFLKFLLEAFLNEKCSSTNDWYNYIKNIFQ